MSTRPDEDRRFAPAAHHLLLIADATESLAEVILIPSGRPYPEHLAPDLIRSTAEALLRDHEQPNGKSHHKHVKLFRAWQLKELLLVFRRYNPNQGLRDYPFAGWPRQTEEQISHIYTIFNEMYYEAIFKVRAIRQFERDPECLPCTLELPRETPNNSPTDSGSTDPAIVCTASRFHEWDNFWYFDGTALVELCRGDDEPNPIFPFGSTSAHQQLQQKGRELRWTVRAHIYPAIYKAGPFEPHSTPADGTDSLQEFRTDHANGGAIPGPTPSPRESIRDSDSNFTSPEATSPPPAAAPQLVTLRDVAAVAQCHKRTLESYKTRGILPDPVVAGGGGKADYYEWGAIRQSIEPKLGRKLPEIFPGRDWLK